MLSDKMATYVHTISLIVQLRVVVQQHGVMVRFLAIQSKRPVHLDGILALPFSSLHNRCRDVGAWPKAYSSVIVWDF